MMRASTVILAVGAVGALSAGLWLVDRAADTPSSVSAASAQPPSEAVQAATVLSMPGVAGPDSALPLQAQAPDATVPGHRPIGNGSAPVGTGAGRVVANPRANAASVAEAARTGKFPERLSPLMAPAPYDHAAFLADPQSFVDTIVPGRAYQTATPGPEVPVLQPAGTASFQIPSGGSCVLAVVTTPFAPVTYFAQDLGSFENSLTTITVQADATGAASATYTASQGVIADAVVLAGSPLASGQVTFHIFVASGRVAGAP